MKKEIVSVIGLGFVGFPTALDNGLNKTIKWYFDKI
tara:strand:+ start:4691 stop:4798 length:108 start_codon:yes stop_codon:yes gene_type:complete